MQFFPHVLLCAALVAGGAFSLVALDIRMVRPSQLNQTLSPLANLTRPSAPVSPSIGSKNGSSTTGWWTPFHAWIVGFLVVTSMGCLWRRRSYILVQIRCQFSLCMT